MQDDRIKVTVIGPIAGTSGYALHTRQLANALYKEGLDVKLDTQVPQGFETQLTDQEVQMITSKNEPHESTAIFVGQPPFWRLALGDGYKHFIGFCVHEGSNVPAYWLDYLRDERVDQVWVPSQHVYDAIRHSFHKYYDSEDGWNFVVEKGNGILGSLSEKIKIVSHGVDTKLFYPGEKKGDVFTFVANKGFVHPTEDRGGIQYALRAFKEEFRQDENVRFLVKINPAYIYTNDREAWLSQQMGTINLPQDGATVQISMDQVPYDKLRDFYLEGDVFVNTTRCEGFGLPGLEAKACGIINLASDFGGQIDYMKEGIDIYIPCSLTPVTHDLAYEGCSWGNPDISEIRKAMRWCFENPKEVRTRGKKTVGNISEWTWKATGEKASEAIQKLYS